VAALGLSGGDSAVDGPASRIKPRQQR